jgi:hypothetical protein
MSDAQQTSFEDQILAAVNAADYRPVTQAMLARSAVDSDRRRQTAAGQTGTASAKRIHRAGIRSAA